MAQRATPGTAPLVEPRHVAPETAQRATSDRLPQRNNAPQRELRGVAFGLSQFIACWVRAGLI